MASSTSSLIAVGPTLADHYSTTSKRSFQDPSKTLGFGGTTKAEKLKEAAKSRGTAVPLMVQFETFDDAVIERRTSKPEYGFDRLLPSEKVVNAADHWLSVNQESFGGYSRKFEAEAALPRSSEAAPAKGRSGARQEKGKGILDTFKTGNNPQDNTLVQRSWCYDLDPATKVRLTHGDTKPEAPVPEGVGLQVGEEVYGGRGSLKDRKDFARRNDITRLANWRESSLRPGSRVFMDDP